MNSNRLIYYITDKNKKAIHRDNGITHFKDDTTVIHYIPHRSDSSSNAASDPPLQI